MTTHRDPALLKRLVDRLTADESTSGVAIHHDLRSGPLRVDFLRPEMIAIVPSPVHVRWGRWSQVEAMMSAMELVVDRFGSTEWVVTLSGQDYPARPLPEVARFLADSSVDAYVDSTPASERFANSAEWRYCYRYYRIPSWVGTATGRRVGRTLARYPRLFNGAWWFPEHGQYLGIRDRTADVDSLVGGSDWLMLNRRAVDHLRRAFADPATRRTWSRCMLASEVFYATTLAGTALQICPRSWRFARFASIHAAHPDTLTLADLPAVRSAGDLFARKVDLEMSRALLDALDEEQNSTSDVGR
jgi:hypothetical protein